MDSAILSLLGAFMLSIIGLFVFIWSMRQGLLVENPTAASVIFARGEIGRVDDPALKAGTQQSMQQAATEHNAQAPQGEAADRAEIDDRIASDQSSSFPVFMFVAFACFWLLIGSVAGMVASIKLHEPDWLVNDAWLSFGRIRTIHLTAVIYGWSSNGCLAIILWLLPRLLRTRLYGAIWAMLGGTLINVGIAAGIGAIAIGWSDGMEFLEIPWQIAIFIFVGFALIILPALFTLVNRKVEHLYVSVWYIVAALLWIALLFLVAKLPGVHTGVQQATTNWWYGHNALGLWFTPVAVGAIYYFLPKIIGRPVRSYNLSLLGFWTLAFFYGQVGGHHLIGGPVPGLADHAVDRAERDDGDPGDRLHDQPGRHHVGPDAPRALLADAALHDVRRVDVPRLVAARVDGGAAQRQRHHALHALHRGARAPGHVCLRHDGAVRRDLLHAAARAELGMAVPVAHHAALLARRRRHCHLLHRPEHRRLAAGRGHARRRAAVHGIGDGDAALPESAQRRRRVDDAWATSCSSATSWRWRCASDRCAPAPRCSGSRR